MNQKTVYKNFEFSWHEGQYFDYWFFVHALTAVGFALLFMIFNMPLTVSVVVYFIQAVLFEIAEYAFGTTLGQIEPLSNSVIDVIVAVVFFSGTYFALKHLDTVTLTVTLSCVTIFTIGLSLYAMYRVKADSKK